jgi:hypothetical protein
MKRRQSMEVGMNRKIIVVFVALGLLTTVGCMLMGSRSAPGQAPGGLIGVSPAGTPVAPPVDGTRLPENTSTQKINNLNVSLALSPYPPVGFKETNFDVTLTDENGQAVTDAAITLDLTMPEMPMPSNTPNLQHTGNGLYKGTGRFTMGGLWRIEVIIQRGGEKQSAFFDVDL